MERHGFIDLHQVILCLMLRISLHIRYDITGGKCSLMMSLFVFQVYACDERPHNRSWHERLRVPPRCTMTTADNGSQRGGVLKQANHKC